MTATATRSFAVEEAVLLRWGVRVPARDALEALTIVRSWGFTGPATVREIVVPAKEKVT